MISLFRFIVTAALWLPCQIAGADLTWGTCHSRCAVANGRTPMNIRGVLQFEPVPESTTQHFLSLGLDASSCFSVRPTGARDAECITLDRVHVIFASPRFHEADVHAAIGRRVAIRAVAIEALSPHHHTPVVLIVSAFAALR
jgi:hypothetical protein